MRMGCLILWGAALAAPVVAASAPVDAVVEPDPVRVAQLVGRDRFGRNYPDALPSLLAEINRSTTLRVHPDPLLVESLADERLLRHPLLYANYADRGGWDLTVQEREGLRRYLDSGGFLFLDAGINAEFLREDVRHGQHHSFADWEVSPDVAAAFRLIYPGLSFRPLPREHPMFRVVHRGLPDGSRLPEAIREHVEREKWPGGTYSIMGLHLGRRLAVVATPTIAMGWGRDELGRWTNRIGFRVREGAEGLGERLAEAAYSGRRYEVTREDGRKDIVYCRRAALPAWVHEAEGRWRVFRYYHATEISDYAHEFYTRLGVNLFVYPFLQ